MEKDIVERLRADEALTCEEEIALMEEAADEIERLREALHLTRVGLQQEINGITKELGDHWEGAMAHSDASLTAWRAR